MKKRVLIIEDEKEMNFRPIQRLKEEYDVEVARSVDATINVLKQKTEGFDLIFLDVMMDSGPYTSTDTDEGMETGLILYQRELRNLRSKIIVWTRNNAIQMKVWGSNVVDRVPKSGDDDQLLNLAQKHIG
jgi:DNA-binding NtrC family response regulator